MSDDDLAEHLVPADPFWQLGYRYDGYDRQSLARAHGWYAVASWGAHGWDLGDWPLVVFYFCEKDGAFLVTENVEGDATTWAFGSEEERNAAVDALAFLHWKHAGAPWVRGVSGAHEMPERLRGPYRPASHRKVA